MRDRDADWVAAAAGARLVAGGTEGGLERVLIDNRETGRGDLFVGLRGERTDGGDFAPAALRGEAWGVLVTPDHAARAAAEAPEGAVVLGAEDPLAALQSLARAWRHELGCAVIGVTGSTGKTSTKDILAAVLEPHRATHCNRQNLNTEIGLPLTILEAKRGTEVLVLEMAMRGEGQIAELVAVAEPDVGVIVNVGPVHLELLGTVERVAAAKAELIRDLAPGAACVVPAAEPLLDAHLREDLQRTTFGLGGDVNLRSFDDGVARIDAGGEPVQLELSYSEPHNLVNTLAAVAAARAVGVTPAGRVAPRFSSMRGEVVELAGGVTVVNDCYNANPMSMRAALMHLVETPADRRVAVLGTMAELGPGSGAFHREIGAEAARLGVDVLITVGAEAVPYAEEFDGESYATAEPEEAGLLLSEITLPGDRVLIKGSRSVGLERVLD